MKIIIAAIVVTVVIMHATFASSETEKRPSDGISTAEVAGKIHFSEYYSKGGRKCTAFIEGEEGTILCVLDNPVTEKLKEEARGISSGIKVKGIVEREGGQRYITVEDYNIVRRNSN